MEGHSSSKVFDYAIEFAGSKTRDNLFDDLVNAAIDEEVITAEQVENMTDKELVAVLKSNFKPDIYTDADANEAPPDKQDNMEAALEKITAGYDEHIANSDTVDYYDSDY